MYILYIIKQIYISNNSLILAEKLRFFINKNDLLHLKKPLLIAIRRTEASIIADLDIYLCQVNLLTVKYKRGCVSLFKEIMNSILITGCNRGIGLGLVKKLLNHSKPPKHLIATCRDVTKAEVS